MTRPSSGTGREGGKAEGSVETALRGRTELSRGRAALELVVRANRGSDVTPGSTLAKCTQARERPRQNGREGEGLERKMKDCLGSLTFGLEFVEKCKLTILPEGGI